MTASAAASVANPGGLRPPRFDPLAPRHRDRAFRRIFVVSLLLHLLFLFVFWDAVLGTVIEKEETVTVRMFEEEQKPEPKKLRPKVLAQRRVDTKVQRFKEIVQPEIVEFRPTPVLDQVKKIEVDPLETTEAPKEIVTREVEARQLSVFADVPRPVAPVEIDVREHKVQQVQVARGSAGPRKLEAAGPETTPEAMDLEAPTVREGVVSKNSVQGTYEGTRIAALESGAADRYLGDEGVPGAVAASKDCMRDPICLAYLKMIRDRVYARWQLPSSIPAGEVQLRFQIDRGGSAHGLRLVSADDSHLGDTCLAAFRHASPFPPPPREIEYLVGKGLVATFDYGR